MATIRTAIELEDHFSNILNNIVSAVNMTVSVMTEMQSAVNTPVEPAVFDGLRDYANQATMAVQELDAARISRACVGTAGACFCLYSVAVG